VLYGRTAALLAAALVAASSTLVEYSTNARGYTLVALATVIVFLAGARAVERDSVGAWALVVVAGALGLYAVPVMIYPLGGALLWILGSGWVAGRELRPLLARLGVSALVTSVLTLVLYGPVYAASGVRSVTANEFVEPRTFGALLDRFPGHVSDTVDTWTRDLPLLVAILLGIGLLPGTAATQWVGRFPIPVVATVVAWALPVLAVQRVLPYTRVWTFLVPLAATTTAGFYGWVLERRRWAARAGPAVAVAVAASGWPETPIVIAFGIPALLLAAAAILHSEAGESGPLRRFGEALGDASYALYLSHPFVVNGIDRLLGAGAGALIVALAASIAFALIFHRYIEAPVTLWLNRRAGERPRPLDDVAP